MSEFTRDDVLALFERPTYQAILTPMVDAEEYGALCLFLYRRNQESSE